MSEKGQGDDSAEAGTGIDIDGTASGGGSAADQIGPHEGDTRTRGRGEWSSPDPDLADLKVSDAPPPTVPEDTPTEPAFPGGGPTDTRSGWDNPSGEGPRGDPPETPQTTTREKGPWSRPDPSELPEPTPDPRPAEWQGPPQETADERAERRQAESKQKGEGAYNRYMDGVERRRAEREGQTSIDPPSLQTEGGTGSPTDTTTMTPEELEEYKQKNPSALKQSEDMKEGHGPIDVT